MTRAKQLLAALLSIALVTSIGIVATGGFAGAQSQEGAASVTIEDQASDGQTVIVDSVTLPEGGFVVIHDTEELEEDDSDSAFDSVIGVSTYLEAGTHEDVPVTMAQELDTTEVDVTAMPHMDTNGNEVFDFVSTEGEVDGPYTSSGAAETETETETEMTETETETETEIGEETETETEIGDEETTTEEDAEIGEETTEEDAGLGEETTTEEDAGINEETTEEEAASDFQQVTETETETEIGEEETETETETETEIGEEETETPEEAEGEPVTDTATIDAVGDGAPATNLEFSNQSTDGSTVTVDRVTLYRGGYVVLHNTSELEDGDELDSIIGHSAYMPPGTYEDVEITLAQPIENGTANVTAMPHHETNQNLVFDFALSTGANDGPYMENDTAVTEAAEISPSGAEETETETEMTETETETETEIGEETETETEIGDEETTTEEDAEIGEETTEEDAGLGEETTTAAGT